MPRRVRRDWVKLVTEYRRSGETQRRFCERRKLSVHTLQYHLSQQKLQTPDTIPATESGFIELPRPSGTERLELELVLPSGAVLRMRG